MTEPLPLATIRHVVRQAQFLDVAGLDEAHARLRAQLRHEPLEAVTVPAEERADPIGRTGRVEFPFQCLPL